MDEQDVERERVMAALKQLEIHAPAWVRMIRSYIERIEKKAIDNSGRAD